MTLIQLKKIENNVIIASLKSETMDKLINRIPGLRLLISSLSGSALRTLVESLGKPRHVNKRSQSLACKLAIKRHSPSILHWYFLHLNLLVITDKKTLKRLMVCLHLLLFVLN